MAITKDCQLVAGSPVRASDVAELLRQSGRVTPESARAGVLACGVKPRGLWFYRTSQAAYNMAKETKL